VTPLPLQHRPELEEDGQAGGLDLQGLPERLLGLGEPLGPPIVVGDPPEHPGVLRGLLPQALDEGHRRRLVARLAQQGRLETGEVWIVGEAQASLAHRGQGRLELPGLVQGLGVEAQQIGARRQARLVRPLEHLGGISEAAELLVGEAQVHEKHPHVAGGLPPLVLGPGHELFQQRGRRLVVSLPFGDRDLEVGRLEVGRVFRDQLVGHRVRLIEPAQVPQRATPQVEGEAVLRIGLQHSIRLLERLVEAVLLLEDVAEG
jgi:hypothetical protein